MDWDQIENNWDYAKLHIKQHWHKLANHHLNFNQNHREHLIKKISEAYKIGLHGAELQLTAWQDGLNNIDGHFYSTHQL